MPRALTGSVRWKVGAWRLQVSAGVDAAGKRRYVTRTVGAPNTKAGERTARQALARLVLEVEAAAGEEQAAVGTFAELLERWLEVQGPKWVDGDAVTHARQVMANHVMPTLGPMQVDAISPEDIDLLYLSLLRKGLAASTVKRIHNNVRACLQLAVRWRRITYNPAAAVEPPSGQPPKPRRAPDAEVIRSAIAAGRFPWLRVLLRLAIHTGARRSELARARWDDVEFVEVDGKPTLAVMSFWQRKTNRYKVVGLGPGTTAVLLEHRDLVAGQCAELGVDMTEWVFPSWHHAHRRSGVHVRPDSITNEWARMRDAVGLAGWKLHELRHGMATQLVTTGHDVKTVAGRGGWSNPSVLLGTYTHQTDEADMRAALALDDWLDTKVVSQPARKRGA